MKGRDIGGPDAEGEGPESDKNTTDKPPTDDPPADEESTIPHWWWSQPLGLWWLLALGVAAGLWFIVDDRIRLGTYVVAGTLGVAALVRLVLPRNAVGGLMIRSRGWDVAVLLALGGAIAVIGALLQLD